jgi:hypothetical protein
MTKPTDISVGFLFSVSTFTAKEVKEMKKLFIILSLFAAFAFMAFPAMALACDPDPAVEVTNTVEVTTDAECTWTVDKTVEEVTTETTTETTAETTALSLDMTEGESTELDYTIEVDKTCPPTADYTFAGQVDVKNEHWLLNVYVEDVNVDISGEDAASPGTWTTIGSVVAYSDEVSGVDDKITPGKTKSYVYSTTLNNLAYGAYSNFQTIATVGSYYVFFGKDQNVNTDDSNIVKAPLAANQEITITDTETIDPNDGGVTYAITEGPNPVPDAGPTVDGGGTTTMSWNLTDDATIKYKKTITANTAGDYVLTNVVTTDPEVPESGTEVDVTVTTPPPVTVTVGGGPTPTLAVAGLTTEVKTKVKSKVAGLQVAGLTELPFTGFNLISNLMLGGGLSLAGISALVASIRRRR